MRHPVIWAAIIVAAGLLAGTAAAQWYNPFESDCAKAARLRAESKCGNGKWKKEMRTVKNARGEYVDGNERIYDDYDDCYQSRYSVSLRICLRAQAGG